MRSIKVYIAGKVTGQPRALTLQNFDRGKKLCMMNGYNFVSPPDVVPEDTTPRQAMKSLIPLLVDCDAIIMLNDYKFSEGAMLELAIVKYINETHHKAVIKVFFEEDLN